jgi:hypothetical protein
MERDLAVVGRAWWRAAKHLWAALDVLHWGGNTVDAAVTGPQSGTPWAYAIPLFIVALSV